MSRAARTVTLALAIVLLTGGAAPANVPDRRLPPFEREDLVHIFDPKVSKFGLQTTRATLQSLDNYASDPKGRHLAIYLEPIEGDFADVDYVESFTDVAKVFLPLVYKRWKGLKSFDVCLEPNPGEDPRREPPPVTQLVVSRRGYKDVGWKQATLADLIAVSNDHEERRTQGEFVVYFDPRLDDDPTLAAARAEAAAG